MLLCWYSMLDCEFSLLYFVPPWTRPRANRSPPSQRPARVGPSSPPGEAVCPVPRYVKAPIRLKRFTESRFEGTAKELMPTWQSIRRGAFDMAIPRPMTDRILDLTRVTESGCWIWLGRIGKRGRGLISLDHWHRQNAHRASFEAFRGPVPEGLELDHLCLNPL